MVVNQLLKYGEFGIVLFDNFQVTERTRNQFVDNTTRGFESLPLRQKTKDAPRVRPLFFYTEDQERTLHRKVRGFAYSARRSTSLLVRRRARVSSRKRIPLPPKHQVCVLCFFTQRIRSEHCTLSYLQLHLIRGILI